MIIEIRIKIDGEDFGSKKFFSTGEAREEINSFLDNQEMLKILELKEDNDVSSKSD